MFKVAIGKISEFVVEPVSNTLLYIGGLSRFAGATFVELSAVYRLLDLRSWHDVSGILLRVINAAAYDAFTELALQNWLYRQRSHDLKATLERQHAGGLIRRPLSDYFDIEQLAVTLDEPAGHKAPRALHRMFLKAVQVYQIPLSGTGDTPVLNPASFRAGPYGVILTHDAPEDIEFAVQRYAFLHEVAHCMPGGIQAIESSDRRSRGYLSAGVWLAVDAIGHPRRRSLYGLALIAVAGSLDRLSVYRLHSRYAIYYSECYADIVALSWLRALRGEDELEAAVGVIRRLEYSPLHIDWSLSVSERSPIDQAASRRRIDTFESAFSAVADGNVTRLNFMKEWQLFRLVGIPFFFAPAIADIGRKPSRRQVLALLASMAYYYTAMKAMERSDADVRDVVAAIETSMREN